jgi:MFS-type transporter involved in bile tolerance (Atg22 family)
VFPIAKIIDRAAALITMAGIMGSIISPHVIGILRELTGNFAAGHLFAAVLLILAHY